MRRLRSPGRRRLAVRTTALLIGCLALSTLPAAPAGAAPAPLPTTEISSAAVVSPSSGRTDLFTRSSRGRLLQQYRPSGGSWTRAVSRGGSIASQPAAVSWGSGRIDVFARGTDNALWHRSYAGGKWSAWTSRGGRLTSAPAVASWGTGRLDVVARGRNGDIIYRRYTTSAGWSRWRSLGGTATASPAIASWGTGRLDVVMRGSDNAIRHKRFVSGKGWSAWKSLGGRATSQPALVAPASGRLDLFIRAGDGSIRTKYFTSGKWSGWTSRGSTTASGPGATAAAGSVRIVARRSNQAIYEQYRKSPTASWGSWRRVDQILPFRRLGTWVKLWDTSLDPATEIANMKSRGVRVLYLQTSRFTSANDIQNPEWVGKWLDAAHKAGIKVVGWYVPGYGNMTRDVRRTVAIGKFKSPGGQRFDAIGVDIEYYGSTGEVSRSTFYKRIAPHLDEVRKKTPAVIGAIVPPPFATKPGTYWDGFPWEVIGPRSEVVIPMVMWSNRTGYTVSQIYTWVRNEVEETRKLTGRPVMAEGGVGTPNTTNLLKKVDAYVRGVRDGKGIGGAHWDYVTTRKDFWPILVKLNEL